MMTDPEYGYTVEVPEGYDEAVIRTRLAMRSEGFSILTEMNVGGMLGPETGDARQYLILGVFDVAVTTKRLDRDLQLAVHLPCNFVVQETDTAAVVAALDPEETVDSNQTTPELIDAARDALTKAFHRIGTSA